MRLFIKLSLLPFFTVAIGTISYGQHSFTLTIPDIRPASKRPVVQTPDGGSVLLFQKAFYDKNNNTESASTDSSFLGLAKFSPDGLIEWSRYFTIGAQNTRPVVLLPSSDGGFIALADVPGKKRDESDIAFFQFNAHGYLLAVKLYSISSSTDITDAILTDDGSILISGSITLPKTDEVKEDDADMYRSPPLLIRTDQRGDALQATIYPDILNGWSGGKLLRNLSGGDVAIVGSVFSSNPRVAAGLACIIKPDGTVRKAFGINPLKVFDERVCRITDIAPNGSGGYRLIGNTTFPMCGGMMFTGFAVELDNNDDTLWTKEYPVWMDHILSSEKRTFTFFGQENIENYMRGTNLEFLSGTVESPGTYQSGTRFALPLQKEKDEKEDIVRFAFGSTFTPTDDGGSLIISSLWSQAHFHVTYELRPPSHFYTLLARLAPDYSSCGGTSQAIDIEEANREPSLDLSDESNSEETTPEVSEGIQDESATDFVESEGTDSIIEDGDEFDDTDTSDEEEESDDGFDSTKYNEWREDLNAPFILKVGTTSKPVSVVVQNIIDFHTVDSTLEPQLICRENTPLITSSRRNETLITDASSTALTLSPNSVRAGQSVGIDFTLIGETFPEITLLTVATGETVRQVEAIAIRWSPASGHGTARIETAGLAAGTYLVRVRSDEKQFISKLEVR